jgi:hypothetical protein
MRGMPRIAARRDKLATNFLAAIQLAAVIGSRVASPEPSWPSE